MLSKLDIELSTLNIEKNPYDALAYCYRGDTYFKYGYFDEALSDFTHAIKADPKLARAYYSRGLVKDETSSLVTDTEERDYSKHSEISLSQRLGEGAEEDYFKAIEVDDSFLKAYNRLGLRYPQYYDKAIKIDPDYSEAYIGRALYLLCLLEDKSYIVEARQDQIKNDDLIIVPRKFHLAKFKSFQSNLEEYEEQENLICQILSDCSRAIMLDPSSSLAYFLKGRINAFRQNYTEAFEDITKAIDLDPEQGGVSYRYSFRGELYRDIKNYKNVVRDLSKALEKFTIPISAKDREERLSSKIVREIELYLSRAEAYLELGDDDRALLDFTNAIGVISNNLFMIISYNNTFFETYEGCSHGGLDVYPIYYKRGILNEKLGNFQESVNDFTVAINGLPNYNMSIGNLYSHSKPNTKALLFYKRALVFDSLGMHIKSIEDYSTAIGLDGSLGYAYYKRGLAKEKTGKSFCDDFKKAHSLGVSECYNEITRKCD